MIGAVWMAAPPEVHSALLNSGPGPGPLLAAAHAWRVLHAEYADAAGIITDLMTTVQAAAWEGAAAESYVAAHAPYLAWLLQAMSASAASAAQHEITAAAYVAALAAMPTPTELAVNHTTHATLLATNFFGINTIAVALNEADYVRMWIQAATTMTGYESVSAAAAAAMPPLAPAPQILGSASSANPAASQNPLQDWLDLLQPILKSLGIEDSVTAHDPMVANALTDFVAHVLQNFGVNWDPAAGMLNGHVYDYYSNAAQPIWYLARSLELFEDVLYMAQDPTQALRAVQYLVALALFDWPTHIAQLTTTISQSAPLLLAAAGAALAPAGALGGVAGLAGLAGLADLPQPAAMPVPLPATTAALPAGMGPPVTAPTAPTPTPSPTATTAGAPAAPTAPPPTGAAGLFVPYAVGPPGIGFGSGTGAAARALSKAPEPDHAAAGAASRTSAQNRARARRRRRAALREGHATAEMDVHVDPDWAAPDPAGPTASDRCAGRIGFAGTESTPDLAAAGLTVLSDGPLAGRSQTPMLPATWGARARDDQPSGPHTVTHH